MCARISRASRSFNTQRRRGTLRPYFEVKIAGRYEFIPCSKVVLRSPIVAVVVITRCPQISSGSNGVLPCQAVIVPSLWPATRHARQYRRLKGHYLRRSNRNPRSLFCWTVETPNHAISTRTGTPPRMRSPGSLHVTRNRRLSVSHRRPPSLTSARLKLPQSQSADGDMSRHPVIKVQASPKLLWSSPNPQYM